MSTNRGKRSDILQQIIQEVVQVGDPIQAYHPETIISLGGHLQQYIEQSQTDGDTLVDLWQQIADIPESGREIYGKILAEFELLEYTQNGMLTDRYLEQIAESTELGWRNQWYLLRQLQGLLFTDTVSKGERTSALCWRIYDQVYEEFRQECISGSDSFPTWIPEEQRQQDFVIVTTSQLLSEQHAPTKTALDRCLVLMQDMQKQVLLVNTAEQGADIGNILLLHRMQTNYKKLLSRKDHISYRGVSIPFLQCSPNMPDVSETLQLLQLVAEKKPVYIVNIGGSSLVTDLFREMVPVLTVATVFSGLATTHSQYQMIGRPLCDRDLPILKSQGKVPEHVISGRFTFALKEQTQTLSRKLLGIPEDCFALVIIGARIGREITDAFADMLEKLVSEGCFPVFIGEMDYQDLLTHHEGLRDSSVYLGSRSDVLAIMEHMDLYINPDRNGGGSSVVEAMVQGVVPLTLPHGDVYVNTGDDFAVSDYLSMYREILHLKRDTSYYNMQSEKAIKRAEVLMDSASAFTEVMGEFISRYRQAESGMKEGSGFQISVIIPCYNVERYIRHCLDSLLQQTLGWSHIQLILVDDASTDDTLRILQEYENKYSDNILLIPLEQNMGQGVARNIALDYAQGDYVGFVDADDWVEKDMYEVLYQAACRYQCDVVICECDRRKSWEETGAAKKPDPVTTLYTWENPTEKEPYIFAHRADVLCMTKLFARQFLQEHRVRFAEGLKYEDHYFGMLVLLHASSLVHIDQVLYHWYQNAQSTCMGGKHVTDRIGVQQMLFEECGRRGFLQYYRELLEYNLYEKMVVETVFYLRRQGKDASEILVQMMQIMQQMGIEIRHNRYYLQETGDVPSI